ncbi:hypothetical protein HanRHA438_Chr16g0749021 [Helianthus annuus]|nr:hypothetical protein HanRHA438_Chr16g0749021 [Helianthus annuus]
MSTATWKRGSRRDESCCYRKAWNLTHFWLHHHLNSNPRRSRETGFEIASDTSSYLTGIPYPENRSIIACRPNQRCRLRFS